MSNFDFKKVLKENLYNLNYPGDDKVTVVLNEGKTLLVEREIHEGIMDLLKGFTKTQPGWEKELERQIDAWLEKSALEDARKLALKRFYMSNLESLPPSFYEDEENLEQVEDSLNAAEEGDVDKAEQELEDAVESAEDEEAEGEEAEAEKGESLKAKKGDLVIAKIGGKQYLLRIGDIVGGEEEEPESRRGSLGDRARRRATGRFGGGSMRLGSGYSGSLRRENILRLNEQEYMIDAGMLLKTGEEYRPEKAVDLTVKIARIATDGDIAKIKEKYPEEFERFFPSQGGPTADGRPVGVVASLVDNNVGRLAKFLLDKDSLVTGALKTDFQPFFKEAGIPWRNGAAIEPIMDLIRQVFTNQKIRNRLLKLANQKNQQNESKEFIKKVLTEVYKAYKKKNEIKK